MCWLCPDSTPNDVTVSPLSDGSRPEDEVFLSPTRSRTTEDLFAVIHRWVAAVVGGWWSVGKVVGGDQWVVRVGEGGGAWSVGEDWWVRVSGW